MKVIRPLLFVILLLFGSPLYAGISVLTPTPGKITRLRAIHLVLRGPLKGLKIRPQKTSSHLELLAKIPFGKKEAVYHFILTLEKGMNVLRIEPGGIRFTITRNPSMSMTGYPSFPTHYLFHRKEAEDLCLPCHKISLKVGNRRREVPSCLPCHKSEAAPSKGGWIHGPVAAGNCFACHRPGPSKERIRFTLYENGTDRLCFHCHISSRRWKKMTHVHGPVGAGNCTFCHNPHGSPYKFYLRYGGKQGLCLVCHQKKRKEFSERGFRFHAILAAEGCTICHNPHASNHAYQLNRATVPLCVGCHTRFRGMKKGHPISSHPLQARRDPLHPQKRFNCVSCHNPHGSHYSYLLIAPQGQGLCSRCHPYYQ